MSPAGEVRTRQGTFPNSLSSRAPHHARAQVHCGHQSAPPPASGLQARLSMTTSQTEKRSILKISDEYVAWTDDKGWSLYGAPWVQPVAIGPKSCRLKSGPNKPKPLPSVATGCGSQRMVRVVSIRPPSC